MNDQPSNDHRQFVQAVNLVLEATIATRLYQLVSQIALVSYKEAANAGYMALCPRTDALMSPLMRLETPMPLDNIRGVRKMLQITLPTFAAFCDGQVVYGFGSTLGSEALVIEFQWPGLWRLGKKGTVIMETRVPGVFGKVHALRKDHFYAVLQEVFGSIPQTAREILWNLMLAATQQGRGTNVLISANAAAKRRALTLNARTFSHSN